MTYASRSPEAIELEDTESSQGRRGPAGDSVRPVPVGRRIRTDVHRSLQVDSKSILLTLSKMACDSAGASSALLTVHVFQAARAAFEPGVMFWDAGLVVFPLMLLHTATNYCVFRGRMGRDADHYR